MDLDYLKLFVRESNMIEGIRREPKDKEIKALEDFLKKDDLLADSIKNFVSIYEPNARLRDEEGLDVYVGNYSPTPGGLRVLAKFERLLEQINSDMIDPFEAHMLYETLHPFTDCNGRSGRAIWLWMMLENYGKFPQLGFLHTFYYQSFNFFREV